MPGYSGSTDLTETQLGRGKDRMVEEQAREVHTHDNNDGSDNDDDQVQLIGLADYMPELHT